MKTRFSERVHEVIDVKQRLTLFEALSLLISAFGLASIIFLIIQTYQVSASLESAAHQTITNQQLEINKTFLEYPELYPYFFSGKSIAEGDQDYPKAIAMADFQLDYFDSFWTHSGNISELQRDGPEWAAWNNYIGDSFKNSPITCRRLRDVRCWYTPDFVDFAKEFCPGPWPKVTC